jgi:16S rRNA (uracil1498-N3)-methyltransferase
MARERRRLLIPPHRLAEEIRLSAAEAHYLSRVLRLAPGRDCEVVDGRGRRWSARLEGTDRLRLEQPLAAPLEDQSPERPVLGLAVALPKRDVDLLWRMATELGIDHLQPLLAERGVGRDQWPEERWRTIVREATEQCERLWLPELAPPLPAAAWLAQSLAGRKLWATTRASGLPHLSAALDEVGDAPVGPSAEGDGVWVAIGPEGGWSPAEEATAQAHGWRPVSGGPTILRTVTAAVAAAAWMAGWRARLSSSSSPGQSP